MLAYIPWFGWMGITAVLGFYAAMVLIFVSKKKRKPKLRKLHVWVAFISLLLATFHGLYALYLFL